MILLYPNRIKQYNNRLLFSRIAKENPGSLSWFLGLAGVLAFTIVDPQLKQSTDFFKTGI